MPLKTGYGAVSFMPNPFRRQDPEDRNAAHRRSAPVHKSGQDGSVVHQYTTAGPVTSTPSDRSQAGLVGFAGRKASELVAKRVDLGIPERADLLIAPVLYGAGAIITRLAPVLFRERIFPTAQLAPAIPYASISPVQGFAGPVPVLTPPLTPRQVLARTQHRLLGSAPDPNQLGGPHPLARTSSFGRGPRYALPVATPIPTAQLLPPPPSAVTYRPILTRGARITGVVGQALRGGAYLVLLGEAIDKVHGTGKIAVAAVVGGPHAVVAVGVAQVVYAATPAIKEFANDPSQSRVGRAFAKGFETVSFGLFGGTEPDLSDWGGEKPDLGQKRRPQLSGQPNDP